MELEFLSSAQYFFATAGSRLIIFSKAEDRLCFLDCWRIAQWGEIPIEKYFLFLLQLRFHEMFIKLLYA